MTAARPPRLLLVTGAAGKTGLAVLRRVLGLEGGAVRVRGWARDAGQRRLLEDLGVSETVVADLNDAEALATGIRDADSVYHICPNVHSEEVAIGRRIIDLAREAGCRRFVYHSVLQPGIREMPHHWAKASVEALLAETDLDFTILQPAPYMQNILGQRSSLTERGVYRVPYDLSTRVSMVDLEDVAEAAARLLAGSESSGDHSRATYELCAPGLLDQTQIANELGRALRRTVRAETTDRSAWARSAIATGMSGYQVETLLAMFRYYEGFGMAGSAEALEGLLGRPPTTFAQFAARSFPAGEDNGT